MSPLFGFSASPCLRGEILFCLTPCRHSGKKARQFLFCEREVITGQESPRSVAKKVALGRIPKPKAEEMTWRDDSSLQC
jgi:hypothetical protein